MPGKKRSHEGKKMLSTKASVGRKALGNPAERDVQIACKS